MEHGALLDELLELLKHVLKVKGSNEVYTAMLLPLCQFIFYYSFLSEYHELMLETWLIFLSLGQLIKSTFPVPHATLQEVRIVDPQWHVLRELSDPIVVQSLALSKE